MNLSFNFTITPTSLLTQANLLRYDQEISNLRFVWNWKVEANKARRSPYQNKRESVRSRFAKSLGIVMFIISSESYRELSKQSRYRPCGKIPSSKPKVYSFNISAQHKNNLRVKASDQCWSTCALRSHLFQIYSYSNCYSNSLTCVGSAAGQGSLEMRRRRLWARFAWDKCLYDQCLFRGLLWRVI